MGIFKVQNISGNQYGRIYNGTTHETNRIEGASIKKVDDFNGAAVDTNQWTETETANATKAIALGLLTYSLTNANEAQDAGVFGVDVPFNIDKGVIMEARVRISTLPTVTAEVQIGLQNDAFVSDSQRIAGADEVAKHMMFVMNGASAAGTIVVYTDDGTVDNNAVATGVTISAAATYVFRIDASNPASVKFYINGVRVAASTTFKLNSTANLLVMPLVMVAKHDGAGLGVIVVDYVKVWQLSR
jgi:hypothetical protein